MAYSLHNSFMKTPFQPASSKTFANKPCSSVRFRQPKIVSAATEAKRPKLVFESMEKSSSSSFYEVLGISRSAGFHEIRSAYRRLARMCHPDVVSVNRKELSANVFLKIHAAYSTLSDPDKRADYDRNLYGFPSSLDLSSLRSKMASARSSMSGFSNYKCRNWETDQCW